MRRLSRSPTDSSTAIGTHPEHALCALGVTIETHLGSERLNKALLVSSMQVAAPRELKVALFGSLAETRLTRPTIFKLNKMLNHTDVPKLKAKGQS